MPSVLPSRRRQYLVKPAFQLGFAFGPLALFALALAAAGVYLAVRLPEALAPGGPPPPGHLRGAWGLARPAVGRAAGWGGLAFAAALAGWGWRRFGTLGRDLDRLADWVSARARGEPAGAAPALVDPELVALAGRLQEAEERFAAWDREVTAALTALRGVAIPGADPAGGVAAARRGWEDLDRALAGLRVEEGSPREDVRGPR